MLLAGGLLTQFVCYLSELVVFCCAVWFGNRCAFTGQIFGVIICWC